MKYIGQVISAKEREKMLNLSSPRCLFFYTLQLLFVLQAKVLCFQHKVGDLNSWTVPTAANQGVYDKWSKNNIFRVKDSLCKFLIYSSLFLLFFLFLNTDLSMQYTIIPSMSLYNNKLFQLIMTKCHFVLVLITSVYCGGIFFNLQ